MSSSAQPPPGRRALLDTTVQVDRVKTGARRAQLDKLLTQFDRNFAASMSLVEFKATMIQECITIHNQFRRKGRFTTARDDLLEKNHSQTSLRAHIFNNLINIHGASSHLVTEDYDNKLAEKARLHLENIIPLLYRWFVEESVDIVLQDRLGCDRAKEPPRKKQAAFETNLPKCRRNQNKFCHVERVIRERGDDLMARLQPFLHQSEQLQRAATVFESVKDDRTKELSHSDCRRAGDCLIALEAEGYISHVVSSNAREWAPLSEVLDVRFVRVIFPEEKTL